jgi:predicted nucleic acid-binding protein
MCVGGAAADCNVTHRVRVKVDHLGADGGFGANFALFLSAITIGELRQGVENIRHRGDSAQAARLERWLDRLTVDYADDILPFDQETAQIWGRLRAPHPENPLDKITISRLGSR